MTLLVSWMGVDTHGVSSAYIATDSRLSWGKKYTFDHAVKTFYLRNFPAVVGYYGDSLSALMIISQATNIIDSMSANSSGMTFDLVVDVFERIIRNGYVNYPAGSVEYSGSVGIVVAGRETIESESFKTATIEIGAPGTPAVKKIIELPLKSGVIHCGGSGNNKFNSKFENYNKLGNANTSRNVFHAFVDSIVNDGDPGVGGPPQVVGVIRKPGTMGMTLGLVFNNLRYICGQLIERDLLATGDIAPLWFNENFEISHPLTKRRKDGAQVQPNSLRR